MPHTPLTLFHVTHEATEKLGGIGTVLEGLITAPAYQRAVRRTFLVAPLFNRARGIDPLARLGEGAVRIRYSGTDNLDPEGLGAVLKPVELAFGAPIVYGERDLRTDDHHPRTARVEVLLVDVVNPEREPLARFKHLLFEKFGLDCLRHETQWDFEEYCRLAQPAWHALLALTPPAQLPAVLVSHEYMGMCTALAAEADPFRRIRTVFHAHECSPVRRIVEDHDGHDAMFYPAMRRALAKGLRLPDVFNPEGGAWSHRHALVSRAHRLGAVLAVGDETAHEFRFLSHDFDSARVLTAYNGVPSESVSLEEKQRSRAIIDRWLKAVHGRAPDFLFTHVARPVVSKAFWRDLRVCAHLERALAAQGKSAVFVLLTCGAPVRSFEEATRMARAYGWPGEHREGPPDVSGPESPLWHDIRVFNDSTRAGAGAVRAMLVNQFGFSRERLGEAAPAEISLAHLRRAADVEFGQSIYEPFGIAQLEPLHAGAICVPTGVCGCVGFARKSLADLGLTEGDCPNLLVADYTRENGDGRFAEDEEHTPLETRQARDAREEREAARIATELLKRLPTSDADRARLLAMGQRLAPRMSWDRVAEDIFLPAIRSVL